MAKPYFNFSGKTAAWGDLAETTEPMLGNLFAVSIKLPTALQKIYVQGGPVLGVLASAADLPEEVIEIAEVQTKLSSYDVAVGKTRGELNLTFKEQVGALTIRRHLKGCVLAHESFPKNLFLFLARPVVSDR